jgi:NAD(P)-dependent dehydrogenase (short-subunit alcohol dehydrogenase family)
MLSPMQTSNIIWITGGGSGIGRAAAIAMARQGTQIVVSGRRPAELEAAVAAVNAAGGSAEAHALCRIPSSLPLSNFMRRRWNVGTNRSS